MKYCRSCTGVFMTFIKSHLSFCSFLIQETTKKYAEPIFKETYDFFNGQQKNKESPRSSKNGYLGSYENNKDLSRILRGNFGITILGIRQEFQKTVKEFYVVSLKKKTVGFQSDSVKQKHRILNM